MSDEPKTLHLDTREFCLTGQEMTAAQEHWMEGHLRAAGVFEILKASDATLETHGEAVLTAILIAGEAEYLLAGMLVELGKRWNRDDALVNVERFATVTDRKEKQLLQALLFGTVSGFFGSEGKFPPTSPSLSAPGETKAATPATEEAATSAASPS